MYEETVKGEKSAEQKERVIGIRKCGCVEADYRHAGTFFRRTLLHLSRRGAEQRTVYRVSFKTNLSFKDNSM